MTAMATEVLTFGVIATLTADLAQQRSQRLAGFAPTRWAMVGRWVAGFSRGVFVHRRSSPHQASAAKRRSAIGWTFHYAVGIVYAGLHLALMSLVFNAEPTLLSR